MSDELLNRARELLARWELLGDCATADTIRDLLAEVERLTEALKAQLEANVSVSNHAVAETRRAIRAEARLRELASAEPVAWQWINSGHFRTSVCGIANADEWFPLIRRPEMPS